MRLLQRNPDDDTFTLKQFLDVPEYAILSHTWGAEDGEVTYDDLHRGSSQQPKNVPGYDKIRFCVQRAAQDGFNYSWVDSCCIDKSSSAELQEAITAMFSWYRNASRCYVNLADVSVPQHQAGSKAVTRYIWEVDFRKSRWFTRGWTLQELLAPTSVEFFSSEGTRLGDKKSLEDIIHEITCLPTLCLATMLAKRTEGVTVTTDEIAIMSHY